MSNSNGGDSLRLRQLRAMAENLCSLANIGIAKITVPSWLMPFMVVPCTWRNRSLLSRMIGTPSLSESELGSKLLSKC